MVGWLPFTCRGKHAARGDGVYIVGKLWVSFAMLVVLCAATALTTFAWFDRTASDIVLAQVRTGALDVSFASYKTIDGTLAMCADGSICDTASVNLYDFWDEVDGIRPSDSGYTADDTYFVVARKAGSIPVDFALDFTLTDHPENIGGFYYQIQDVTAELGLGDGFGPDLATDASIQERLGDYIAANTEPNAQERALPEIERETVFSTALREGTVCVYRLRCGLQPAAGVQYLDTFIGLKVSLDAAQVESMIAGEGGVTRYVDTADSLAYWLDRHCPGDTLLLTADIEYSGDLIVNRPVRIRMAGHVLTVQGNAVFSYSGKEGSAVDMSDGGRFVLERVGSTGGNVIVDVPEASFEVIGSGERIAGVADWLVPGTFTVRCAYPSPDDEYDNSARTAGFVLTHARVAHGLDAAGAEGGLQEIIVRAGTSVTVGLGTAVGALTFVDGASAGGDAALPVRVLNRGAIGALDFSALQAAGSQSVCNRRCIPQVFVRNFGSIGKPIALPAGAVPFCVSDEGQSFGNVRIVLEQGGAMASPGTAGAAGFTDTDVELAGGFQGEGEVGGEAAGAPVVAEADAQPVGAVKTDGKDDAAQGGVRPA